MTLRLIALLWLVLCHAPFTIAAATTPPPPTEGIWWSSEAPGTGVAFNIDAEDRWFAALYLYDEDGRPTFLTMQGTTIEYSESDNIDADEPPAPYARVTSQLIRSEGGQCLKCPWTPSTAAASGDGEASILFYGRNRAKLNVGDWSIRLAPLLEQPAFEHGPSGNWTTELFDLPGEYFTVTVATPAVNAVVTAKLKVLPQTLPMNPYVGFGLDCVDCRVPDGGSNASEEAQNLLAGPKYLETLVFRCPRRQESPYRVDCAVDYRFLDSPFIPSAFYVSQDGSEITVLDHGDGEMRAPGQMFIRALPVGWEPKLP